MLMGYIVAIKAQQQKMRSGFSLKANNISANQIISGDSRVVNKTRMI